MSILPGFTAEVSLYEGKGQYQGKQIAANFSRPGTVEMARKRRDQAGLSSCLNACSKITTTLEGSVACSDYCHCVYETDNSWWTCLRQTVEDRLTS